MDLPAAQPVSQAATSVSSAASGTQAKASDAGKDTGDESALTKLGTGDLIEVNVYNIPDSPPGTREQFGRHNSYR